MNTVLVVQSSGALDWAPGITALVGRKTPPWCLGSRRSIPSMSWPPGHCTPCPAPPPCPGGVWDIGGCGGRSTAGRGWPPRPPSGCRTSWQRTVDTAPSADTWASETERNNQREWQWQHIVTRWHVMECGRNCTTSSQRTLLSVCYSCVWRLVSQNVFAMRLWLTVWGEQAKLNW